MSNLQKFHKNQKGFNLIELMIVIAIIGLLIGVGSYGWSAMVKTGNENSATQLLDRIRTLQVQYAGKNRNKFSTFQQFVTSGDLDDRFVGDAPVVNGYIFRMTVEEPSQSKPAFFSVTADPQVAEGITATGNGHFYTDSTLGTIKKAPDGENRPAKAEDPSI